MLSKLSLALIPALAAAVPYPYPQEFHSNAAQIVGGLTASAGQFPYIISLQFPGRHWCGGSLLNANTVITAGHCVDDSASNPNTVRAGSLLWASGGVTSTVSQYIINPKYVGNDNDIAILKLSTPIPEGNGIAYVKLPGNGTDPVANTSSTVAGWGDLTESGSSPADLRYVDVPIVSRTTCKSQYGSSAITNNMVCAAVPEGGKDSCQGDSGGPLIETGTNTLIGIVSWGRGCARRGFAGVYTRVSTQLDFINANI
ncbi:putative trypsin [Periconia macrospinosa]|uniref:Putative trypsin n=1 Tax=Periconia macrospinosa TaxID=97972 RepID=A0A2V1DTG0_9PLEO|nr:putative trypsin [Periconia macrospinosa]